MRNYVQAGNVITATAPYDLASGDGALVGAMFGIASTDAAEGADAGPG
jgi:predicted RecA/RadA family phage recombinase